MDITVALFILGVMLTVIGTLLLLVLNGVKGSIVDVKEEVKGVKIEVKNLNDKVERIEGDLHSRVTEVERRHSDTLVSIDRRLSKVEARCAFQHSEEKK